jgi:glucose 1-dehydrogenase
MLKGIESKNVLVTGAAQGIGFAVAKRFAEEGASVFIVDRVETAQMAAALEKIRSVAKSRKALIAGHRADISNEAAVDEGFKAAVAALGQIDILVNNAGINRGYPSDQFPVEEFDQVLNVNLRAVFIFSQFAIRHFLERKIPGVIVNNSSNHESQPKPGFIAYSVSKGGLGNLTKTLALEFADRGIRINSVAPGAVVTPLNKSWTDDPQKRANVESHIPLGKAATAEEIAGVFAFLASEDAVYITGQTIYADGGLTLSADYRKNWAS